MTCVKLTVGKVVPPPPPPDEVPPIKLWQIALAALAIIGGGSYFVIREVRKKK